MEIYSRNIILNNEYCRSVVAIDVTEKNQQDRRIIKAIIKTQEDERYEIGGELHDNVCQLLAVSQLSLGMLKPSLAEDAVPLFDQCKDNIGMALTEIRNLSHRLAPVFFNDISLEVAFRKLIDSFNIDNKYCVAIYVDPSLGEYVINPDIQLNLYRIMQEQLRNIVKYSQGTEIELDVVIYQHMIRMKIADNGVGFNPQTVKSGIGLANMKRRAELFSGNFELSTSPGNGCTIIIGIPIQSNLEILTDQKLELA
jgi:signal transduction histidine kinase